MKYVAAVSAAVVIGGCAVGPQPLPVQAFPELPMAPGLCQGGSVRNALVTVGPRYPRAALDVGQTGWVIIYFDVASDGSTSDIGVAASSPPGVFEAAGVNALRQWKFAPGSPRIKCRLDFTFKLQ